MRRFKSKGFNNTFKNARKGIRLGVKSEKNIRVHLIVASLVIAMGFVFQFTVIEFAVALLAISNVIVAELINTAIEFSLDSVFHNKYNKMVGMAKDISAGAVMFATVVSVIIGVLLFGKAAFDIFMISAL